MYCTVHFKLFANKFIVRQVRMYCTFYTLPKQVVFIMHTGPNARNILTFLPKTSLLDRSECTVHFTLYPNRFYLSRILVYLTFCQQLHCQTGPNVPYILNFCKQIIRQTVQNVQHNLHFSQKLHCHTGPNVLYCNCTFYN
jgi:hypothetical protein